MTAHRFFQATRLLVDNLVAVGSGQPRSGRLAGNAIHLPHRVHIIKVGQRNDVVVHVLLRTLTGDLLAVNAGVKLKKNVYLVKIKKCCKLCTV